MLFFAEYEGRFFVLFLKTKNKNITRITSKNGHASAERKVLAGVGSAMDIVPTGHVHIWQKEPKSIMGSKV
jgi:hypothetical protein